MGEVSGLLVRPFAMVDYDAVRDLWANAGEGVRLGSSDEPNEIAKKLARDPDVFLVAELAGRIVGVIVGAWDGRRGWIHHLAVDGDCRRQGIATHLVSEVEERLRAKGCRKVNLLVLRGNHAARSLYGRLGYSEMTPVLPMCKEL